MAPPKKKVGAGPTPDGATVTYPNAEERQQEEVEVEHTADGELEVGLEGLGVAAEDIAALRQIEAAVAEVAARTQQATTAGPSTSHVRTRQSKGKALAASNEAEEEELRQPKPRYRML